MGRKKRKTAKAQSVEAEAKVAALAPVDRSAFDRVDPTHVPARRVEQVAAPKTPRRRTPTDEAERRFHAIWMTLLGLLMFFLMRMMAGQNAEVQKKIERVRTEFRPTICTIEGVQTMSGNKVGRRANYEYSWIVDGRGFRGLGYAPDGPKPGVSDEELRNAFPVRTRVPCLYDPTSPSTAYLTSGSVSSTFPASLFQWLAAVITLAGVGHFLYDPLRRRLRER